MTYRFDAGTMLRPVALAALILAGLSATAAPVRAVEISPALKQVIAAADQEGTIKLSWSAGSLGGAAAAAAIETAMNKAFGSHVKVDYAIGPSMPELGFRMLQEMKASRPASADIFIGAAAQIALFAKSDMFEQVDYKSLLPDRITDPMIEENGTALAFSSSSAGILYNTKLAPERPTSLADMLKPEWKGKIATTSYLANFDFLAATDVWGADKAIDFAKQFNGNVAGLVLCPATDNIISGEYLALVMDCGTQGERFAMEQGAPIDQVVPKDFAKISYYYYAIPKHAVHKNAAKLFTAFMLTREGQEILWKTWRGDLHLLPGSQEKAWEDDYAKKYGVTFRIYTIDWYEKHTEMGAALKQMQTILVDSRKN